MKSPIQHKVKLIQDFMFHLITCKFDKDSINPCLAEKITMPYPFLIFSQSNCLTQVVDTNLHIE